MNEHTERFKKVYANLPEAEKKITIVIIDGKNINWEQANKEITNKTELSSKIIEKLISQEII